MVTLTRNKSEEALAAYYAGTAAALPADNPYRWLVQNHDFNAQHRGMQPNCPVCTDELTLVDEWDASADHVEDEAFGRVMARTLRACRDDLRNVLASREARPEWRP